MMIKRFFQNDKIVDMLAKKLLNCKQVTKYSRDNFNENEIIAFGLQHIEDAMLDVYDKLLPLIMSDDLSEDKLEDAMIEITAALSHVIYHINDSKYFRTYVYNEKEITS